MKKQVLLCIDFVARLQEEKLKPGEGRRGTIIMTEDQEKIEFTEEASRRCKRNPIVWRGKYFNISMDCKGIHHIHFRPMELNGILDPLKVADEMFLELEKSKTELGV